MCKEISTKFSCSHEVTKRYCCPGTWNSSLASLYGCSKFEQDCPMEMGPCNDCRAVSGLPLISEKLTAECADGTVCDEIDEEASDSDEEDDDDEETANDEDAEDEKGEGKNSGGNGIQGEGDDQSGNQNVIS